MLLSVEWAFVGRDKTQAPLKMPAWEAILLAGIQVEGLTGLYSRQKCAKQILHLMNKKNCKFLIF